MQMMLRWIVVFMLVFTPMSWAQDMHNPNDPEHWYDLYCCHLKDCGPVIKWEKKDDGWIITTPVASAFLPKDYMNNPSIIVKPSRDARFHACIYKPVFEGSTQTYIRCLYIPMNS